MPEPVCLISGVGAGAGAGAVRRFAAGGYRVAMLARREDVLRALESECPGAKGFPCDITDADAVHSTITQIRAELGAPDVLVSNAVGIESVFGDFLEIDPKGLEANFHVNTMGLLHLARAVAPAMIEAGRGAIVVTGNTAATRGRAQFASFAPSKAAQRILAESMARSLAPRGVHVSYVVIDGPIDGPFARSLFADEPDEFFMRTEAIADTLWHLAHQDPSAWSFLVDLRPFGEPW